MKNFKLIGKQLSRNELKNVSGGAGAPQRDCAGAMCGGFAGAECEGTCVCKYLTGADFGYCRRRF